jgi:DNA-binding transcriptional MerR regulator
VDKAPDAFRTISEVADELDVPQHVLRFWESRFREIKPMKRGGGRRYYRPDDVELLRGIRHLLYGEGYTIRGVQRILREQGAKFVQAVWHPGAPQPAHGATDEGDAAPDEADTRRGRSETGETERGRGLFGLLPSLLGDDDREGDTSAPPVNPLSPEARPEPRPEPRVLPSQRLVPPVVTPPGGLTREDVRKLQSVLHELGECRKLIDAALAQPT